ncbi:NAD(P)H-dependent oxidoreductase [Oceanihabitans sp. IOP_32]|uniref:NADPH-dependent FMN reductase n=1 Tax=Oceanihabitans sp. IOP_32 TaxID=2529032 RepID=UPI001293F139|nr:NAD(P)H-dependent oxidoreductase [Oceanihabitans sp. IOP_32]QFZ55574.1 NAD(P)H-dependent oxidoreductase [Oceanihabitans sp. IOP_32]
MKHIITFAGSNSKNSINKALAIYAASLIEDVNIDVLDLNDFELPLFGIDLEEKEGIPARAQDFLKLIKESDGVVLSLAEHNGAYTTAFKNLFDWMSRIDVKVFNGKPMLLMATSPGARGGASVLAMAQERFPCHDSNIVEVFSLPSFSDNFSEGKIINDTLNSDLKAKVETFTKAL